MNKYIKILAFIPALCLMYFIFGFSSEGGEESSGLSYMVTEAVVYNVDQLFNMNLDSSGKEHLIDQLHTPIRKLAHMSEYAILAVFWYMGLFVNGVRRKRLLQYSIGICIAYACTDEFHQLFVPGRSGKITDVMIDTIGILIGIGCVECIRIIKKKLQNRRSQVNR